MNLRPQLEHDRLRRITWPSSTSRESTTRESECRQNGHLIARPLFSRTVTRQHPCVTATAWLVIDLWMERGQPVRPQPQPVDYLQRCNY
nr:hypothetical protein [Kibdelosporangium sp. MJ126-NF4]CTQ96542.1 hypothetical protein [Kibdelosporangium sp. MJ126-NF4]